MNLNCLATNQSVEEVITERAVKTTTKLLYDMWSYDFYDNTHEKLKDHLLFDEVNERRRLDLEELNNDVIQWFYSWIQFER